MSSSARIILVTPNIAYEQRVRQAFGEGLNGDLRRLSAAPTGFDGAQALNGLAADSPDVVALGPGLPVETVLDIARRLDHERPEISVLVIADPTPDLWERALRAGVRDLLPPEAADANVRAAFQRALDTAERRRTNLVGEPEQSGSGGRVIVVLSPKGGSGKTTTATNLAVGLAAGAPGQVAIADLDLQFGDVASALGLNPEHSLADAARSPGTLDPVALKTLLTPHPSSLYALCAPDSPAEGEQVDADLAAEAVRILASEFSYVIVDTSAGLSEHTLAALEVATDLLLLCAMDVPSVRSLRKEILALEQLGMTRQVRHFVLNRADARVGLATEDVEATVGLSVNVAVSSSRSVPLSLNQGSPLLESDARSPVAKQFQQLVDRFAEQPAARSTGLFGWLKESR